jgi:hypothetical protein
MLVTEGKSGSLPTRSARLVGRQDEALRAGPPGAAGGMRPGTTRAPVTRTVAPAIGTSSVTRATRPRSTASGGENTYLYLILDGKPIPFRVAGVNTSRLAAVWASSANPCSGPPRRPLRSRGHRRRCRAGPPPTSRRSTCLRWPWRGTATARLSSALVARRRGRAAAPGRFARAPSRS